MKKFFKFLRNLFGDTLQERRFKSEYDQLKIKFFSANSSSIEFERNSIKFKDGIEVSDYAEHCKNVINFLDNGVGENIDTDSKFKLLNAVKRQEIMEYDNWQCDIMIKRILLESSKLDDWRKEAILELLSEYKKKGTPADNGAMKGVRFSLREAAQIFDVHFDNLYYKSKIAKKTISFLNWILVLLLSTFLIYAAFLEYGGKTKKTFLLGPFSDLWLVILFGVLGAAFSTLLNLYKSDKLKNRVVKQIDAVNLAKARLIIGASAGLIVFLILNSELITIKGVNDAIAGASNAVAANSAGVRTPKPLTVPMLSLVFIAGFTERLVLNFIERISAQAERPVQDIPDKQPPGKNPLEDKNNGTVKNKDENQVTAAPPKILTEGSGQPPTMEIKLPAQP